MRNLPSLLKGERVSLRSLTKDDAATITTWYQNADFMRGLEAGTAFHITEDMFADDFIAPMHKSGQTRTYSFGIRRNEDEELVGFVNLEGILWQHGVASLGIGVSPDYWGNGYAREGISLLMDFAFEELNLYRVGLSVFAYNERAIGLYESLGFVKEGAHRGFLRRGRQRYDMLMYGLLAVEWRN